MKKPYLTWAHLIAELIGLLTNITAIVYTVVMASVTEGNIATHYDLYGNVDGYGSPWSAIILPIIMLIANITIMLSAHAVDIKYWNMPFKVNPERALFVYRDCAMAIVLMETAMGVFALLSSISFFSSGKMIVPISIGLIVFITIIIVACIIKAAKDNKAR